MLAGVARRAFSRGVGRRCEATRPKGSLDEHFGALGGATRPKGSLGEHFGALGGATRPKGSLDEHFGALGPEPRGELRSTRSTRPDRAATRQTFAPTGA